MYEVERTHSQLATTQPGGLSCLKRSKLLAVPPGACDGRVVVAAQDNGGLLAAREVPEARQRHLVASMSVIRLASRRCCSSACGMAILFVSTQSGWTSPARAP